MRERLCLPYFSTKERGTGLGLSSIAAQILREHRGLSARREICPGAKFIMELRPASSLDGEPSESTPVPSEQGVSA